MKFSCEYFVFVLHFTTYNHAQTHTLSHIKIKLENDMKKTTHQFFSPYNSHLLIQCCTSKLHDIVHVWYKEMFRVYY